MNCCLGRILCPGEQGPKCCAACAGDSGIAKASGRLQVRLENVYDIKSPNDVGLFPFTTGMQPVMPCELDLMVPSSHALMSWWFMSSKPVGMCLPWNHHTHWHRSPDIPGVEVHAAHGYLLDQCLCIILELRVTGRLRL